MKHKMNPYNLLLTKKRFKAFDMSLKRFVSNIGGISTIGEAVDTPSLNKTGEIKKKQIIFFQSTGFNDRNGYEIYEGHILRRWILDSRSGKIYPSDCDKHRIVVQFKNGGFNIKPKMVERIEIMGHVSDRF